MKQSVLAYSATLFQMRFTFAFGDVYVRKCCGTFDIVSHPAETKALFLVDVSIVQQSLLNVRCTLRISKWLIKCGIN